MPAAKRKQGDALRGESERARRALLEHTVAAPGEDGLEAVAERVAGAVAEAEPMEARAAWRERFAGWIRTERFWPSIPILSNAGRGGQLAACFVLAADDSLDSIYETLRRAARIQQGSGGAGIDFSRLRPRGSPIERSGGASPGPVAFVELCAHSGRVNALSGRRTGAHLAVLRDDHPDIRDFVAAAVREPEALAGAGLAVSVGDALLEAARRGAEHALRDPQAGAVGTVPARTLLEAIARSIRTSGQPTLLFRDVIAASNPVPQLGALEATNPCGEQPLLPDESCVLGSLQLPRFADPEGRLDAASLAEAAADAVRFLDDVIEVNCFPDGACAEATRRTRKVGLGVMGFADLLLLRGEAYGGTACERSATEVMEIVSGAAHEASQRLAGERGAFPAADATRPARRNASTLAIAPTGTLRLLAGCSGGLEPFLDPVVEVRTDAQTRRWIDRWLLAWLERRGAAEEVLAALEAGVPAQELPGLDASGRRLLRRAHEIDPEQQIAVQARFQAHVDGAVSKTVHLPADTSATRIVELIALARERGCKGVAFYRREGLAPAPCVRCGP